MVSTGFPIEVFKRRCKEKGVYQTLKEIHHPNIICVVDVFDDEEFLYVVEEYLEWKVLADVIEEDGPLGSRALSVGKQLLEALSVLQKHRIVHRDIKPENCRRNSCVKDGLRKLSADVHSLTRNTDISLLNKHCGILHGWRRERRFALFWELF